MVFELPNKRLQKHDRRWIDYCYNYRICTTNRDTLWERLADAKAMSELSPPSRNTVGPREETEIGALPSHSYTHLPLLPLDEYLHLFPEQAMLSEEEIMPLRIEYERQERERMEKERLELVKVKEGLVKENAQKKEELRKMDEKLEAMIDSLKPIEEAMAKDV